MLFTPSGTVVVYVRFRQMGQAAIQVTLFIIPRVWNSTQRDWNFVCGPLQRLFIESVSWLSNVFRAILKAGHCGQALKLIASVYVFSSIFTGSLIAMHNFRKVDAGLAPHIAPPASRWPLYCCWLQEAVKLIAFVSSPHETKNNFCVPSQHSQRNLPQ